VFGWHPGIGDPTIYGWATVAAYGVGAVCCWWASRRAPSRERRFWQAVALVMAVLCINKRFDLSTLLTDAGRFESKVHGWYAARNAYQIAYMALIAGVCVLVAIALLRRFRRVSGAVKGAIVGIVLLLLFVAVKASSFHTIDWLINLHLGHVRANTVMEIGGIALVTVFALVAGRPGGKRRLSGR
jgi:hypothetical protein